MKNKKIDFNQQIKNSEKFLEKVSVDQFKLVNIKKTSKDIKDKNKLTQHRNLWVKEFKYLSRLQRDLNLDITNYFQKFDHFFQFEIEERQIFGADNYKNYSQLKAHIQDQFGQYEAKTFQQVESLPLLVEKCHKLKKQDINGNQIRSILKDIGSFLQSQKTQIMQLEDQLAKPQEIQIKMENQNTQEQQVSLLLKSLGNAVKGFDFQKEKIKKLRQGEQNLLEYLQCFNDKLTEDQIYEVINQFNHANNLLQQTFELQNEKINLDYEDALSLDSEIIGSSLTFDKINHIYQTYIGRGKSISLYYERLTIQFPKINRKHLQQITAYVEAKIYKDKKLKAAKRNYYREKEDLFEKVQKEVHLRIQKKIQLAQKQAETLSRRQQKLKLQKQLQALRFDYNKRKQEKQAEQKMQQQAKKQAERKQEAIRRLYLDELSKKASQIHEKKLTQQEQTQKEIQDQKQKQILQKKKQVLQNKPKVQKRQTHQLKKVQKRLEYRELKQKESLIKQERINKAIQNYSFRPQVLSNQERLYQPTQALIKRKETVMDKADKVELSKMTGFTVNQLMSDMRFKLNTALQQAGLSNTDYARQILNDMSKRPN